MRQRDHKRAIGRRKAAAWIPALPALALVLACVPLRLYGQQAPESAAPAPGSAAAVVAGFSKLFLLVEQDFATPLDLDKAFYVGAIPGMLQTLDPHSTFFGPREFKLFREEQRGRYYGVGMRVLTQNGKTEVAYPIPGSPAYKAGVRPGDVIVGIDGKPAANLSATEVSDLLKGPKGSAVGFDVAREGVADPIHFAVVRDEIPQPSVDEAFWLGSGIAYVHILSFGETTSKELDDTLKRLGEASIRGLVLDLRDNPGGMLTQCVAVADRFLPRNELIVSHRGRMAGDHPFVSRSGDRGRDYPIVALVNHATASAAEILAGALQDHDRAWILGETTFGKGLVQTVYPLAEETGLALTTAHFYTPSGRLIQRDYSNVSFYDYYNHKDPNARNPGDVKHTDSGRVVYGGGGIAPDEKYETPKLDSFETELYRQGLFDFTRSYFAAHRAALAAGWMPDADVIEDLHDYLLDHGSQFTEAEFTLDHDWIRRNLAREMYISAFDVNAAGQMFERTDPEVLRAIDSLPKAAALLDTAKRAAEAGRTAGRPADN